MFKGSSIIKSKRGQALLESTVVIMILLALFFAMMAYGIYVYNKIVVVFAANLALDEGIGKIADAKITRGQLEDLMKRKAAGAMQLGLLIKKPIGVTVGVNKVAGGVGKIHAGVKAEYIMDLPLVSSLIPTRIIESYVEVDYYWPPDAAIN